MRKGVLACLLALSIASLLSAAEAPPSLVRVRGCSGVNVDPRGLVLTVKHCECPELASIAFADGRTVEGRRIYEAAGKDGPVAFQLPRLSEGAYPFSPVAESPPDPRESVSSWGYPAGSLAYASGRFTSASQQEGVPVNIASFAISPGWSGGPLFNARGEVIGLARSTAIPDPYSPPRPDDWTSAWIGWRACRDAYLACQGVFDQPAPSEQPQEFERDKPKRVVVFTLRFANGAMCPPCAKLHADVDAGKFPGYDFEFVTYDQRLGSHDKPELYAQFAKECRVNREVGAPTIWIPGTGKFREGYDARPAGLIGWIESVVKFVLYGPPPAIPLTPIPDLSEPQPTPAPAPPAVVGELQSLKDQLLKLKADVETFQASGVVGKIQGVAVLKEDKRQLEASISALKSRVDDVKQNPTHAAWTLLAGLFSGLLHGRLPLLARKDVA